jgi:hypothetical protein
LDANRGQPVSNAVKDDRMKPGFVFPILLGRVLSGPIDLLARVEYEPNAAQKNAQKKDVARVLVLESSGNTDVEKHCATELSKWTFAPAERDKKQVRSVVPVAITLQIK